jgi:hypothetical protein
MEADAIPDVPESCWPAEPYPGKRFDYLTIDADDHYLVSTHLARLNRAQDVSPELMRQLIHRLILYSYDVLVISRL